MLKGLGSLGDMARMLKKAQEMQARVTEIQEKIAELEAEGEAGAGLVKAVASGKGEVKRLSIDESILRPEDREAVEDLILAAIRDAQEKAMEAGKAEMAKLVEGLDLPPDVKLPF